MKNPSRHWVNHAELDYYSSGLPRKILIRLLRRCDRTIRDWQARRRPVPAWAIETLKVRRYEGLLAWKQMCGDVHAKLASDIRGVDAPSPPSDGVDLPNDRHHA